MKILLSNDSGHISTHSCDAHGTEGQEVTDIDKLFNYQHAELNRFTASSRLNAFDESLICMLRPLCISQHTRTTICRRGAGSLK